MATRTTNPLGCRCRTPGWERGPRGRHRKLVLGLERSTGETAEVQILSYERSHLAGVIALCEAEGWRTFPADHDRAGFRIDPPFA